MTTSQSRRVEPTSRRVPAGATELPWRDLATNRPGESAHQQAVTERRRASVRLALGRVIGVPADGPAWRIGAEGERLVDAQLEKLAHKDPRWRVLHAIPFGARGCDLDHLVIGPGGVFTLTVKHHPNARICVAGDTLLVDGIRTRYVRHARQEAARATTLLSNACGFPVHGNGLIVTVNARDVVIKSQPDGVAVTWRNHLVRTMRGSGEVLPAAMIEAIYEVARRSTTWGA